MPFVSWPQRLSTAQLSAYASLQLPLAMVALPVVLNVAHLYGDVLHLSLNLIGSVLIASRLIDALQDPLLGFFSDRLTRFRNGRLRLVMLSLPLLGLGFWMLFAPPAAFMEQNAQQQLTHPYLLMWWLFAALVVVHLGYAGASISYHAHGAELSDDYHERTRVTVAREVFGLTGMTIAVVLPTYLTATYGEIAGYGWLALLFLPLVIAFAFPTLMYSPPSVHAPVQRKQRRSILHDFMAPLKNPLYRRLLAVYVVNGASLGVAVSVMLFYVEHVLGSSKQEAGIILLAYFIAGACSVPLWLVLCKRVSKSGAWFIGMLLSAVAIGLAGFAGPGQLALFVAASALTGVGLGADYGIPPSILADIIHAEEGQDSKGETGAYFGLWALATKLATAIGAAASLPVAAALGFNPAKGAYDTFALVVVYIGVPIVLKCIAAVMIWTIRIEPTHSSFGKDLKAKRSSGAH